MHLNSGVLTFINNLQMEEKVKPEESAQPSQEEQQMTHKEARELEIQRKAYVKNWKNRNEAIEEEVKFLRLQVEKYTLNNRIMEINRITAEQAAANEEKPEAPAIEVVKSA